MNSPEVMLALVFLFFGFILGGVFIFFAGLAFVYRKETFARVYYGIPALLIILFLILNIRETLLGNQERTLFISSIGGYIGFLSSLFSAFFGLKKSERKNVGILISYQETSWKRLIDKLILFFGWLGVGSILIDGIFFDRYDLFIINRWWTKITLFSIVADFILLTIRRLFLKS